MSSKRASQRSLDTSSANRLIEELAYCYELVETCATKLRPMGEAVQKATYQAACDEWQNPDKPNAVPSVQQERLRKEFFEQCRAIFQSKPQTPIFPPRRCWLVMFTCQAMVTGMFSLGSELQLHPAKLYIMSEANRISMERIRRAQPNLPPLPSASELPEHLAQTLYPVDVSQKPGAHLLNEVFKYRDPKTGSLVACAVHDCGTSVLYGEWFEVVYGESEEPKRISSLEMADLWAARVRS